MNELERIAKIAGVSFDGTSNQETLILEDAKTLSLLPEKDVALVPTLTKEEFQLALECFEKILDQNANADYLEESLWGALKAAVQVGTKDAKAGVQKVGDAASKLVAKKTAEISRVYQSGEMQKAITSLQEAKKALEIFWKKLQASRGFKDFDQSMKNRFQKTLTNRMESLERFIQDLSATQTNLK
jgi:tetratricopeptide (TPR) repeat protein